MKKILTLLFIIPTFCFGQIIFESVFNQTVVVHSISNLEGNRYVLPFKLPNFTNGYIIRITVSQINREPQNNISLINNILSLTSNAKGVIDGAILVGQLIHPPTSENIDFFILDGANNAQNFQNKVACEDIYQSLSTVSMNTYIDKIPSNGYLCLRNMNTLQGVTVHVEMVAEIGWGRNFKQKIYNEIKEKMESVNKYSSDEITTFCDCFVKTMSSKDIAEAKNMLDDEIKNWEKEIINNCKTKSGITK